MNGPTKRGSNPKSGSDPGFGAAKGRVALFVTCLVDLFRPEVGFAAVRLLEQAGFSVEVPSQGCCGQPNFNSGDRPGAAGMARDAIRQFSDFDYVVAPSGSCAAMPRNRFRSPIAPITSSC